MLFLNRMSIKRRMGVAMWESVGFSGRRRFLCGTSTLQELQVAGVSHFPGNYQR
jgi:hypothetical protein